MYRYHGIGRTLPGREKEEEEREITLLIIATYVCHAVRTAHALRSTNRDYGIMYVMNNKSGGRYRSLRAWSANSGQSLFDRRYELKLFC